jgi:hypothetical protein
METKENSIIEEILNYNPFLKAILLTLDKEALNFISEDRGLKFYKEILEIYQRFDSNGKLKKGEKIIDATYKGIDYNDAEADKVLASFKAIILALNQKIVCLQLDIMALKNEKLKELLTTSEN